MSNHDAEKAWKETAIGFVPQSWQVARLGEKAHIKYGLGQPPAFADNGVPMIRATDIKQGRIVESTIRKVKRDTIPATRNPFLRTGDIIVVRSGAYTGDVAMYDGRWDTAIAGYDLVVSVNRDYLHPEFVTACLLGTVVQTYFRSQRDRSAQPHLNAEQVARTLMPIPPLDEQRAIAATLRAVQEARDVCRRELAAERERKAALMEDLFTHGVRGEARKETEIGLLPQSWRYVTLGNLCADGKGFIQTGPFGSQLHASDYKPMGIPVVNPTHLGFNTIRESDLPRISTEDAERLSRHYLTTGDILI